MWRLFSGLVAGNFVARILTSLGLSYLSFQGLSWILDQVGNQIRSTISGLPGDVLSFAGMADLDLSINLILSAYAARIAIASLTRLAVSSPA